MCAQMYSESETEGYGLVSCDLMSALKQGKLSGSFALLGTTSGMEDFVHSVSETRKRAHLFSGERSASRW